MQFAEKDFDKWNEKKKELDVKIFNNYVHEREVWWCILGVNIGSEQDGKHQLFERPVLVIRKFSKDVVLIVPLSSKKKENAYCIAFAQENQEYSALISQVRLISTKRLNRKIYRMNNVLFNVIRDALRRLI